MLRVIMNAHSILTMSKGVDYIQNKEYATAKEKKFAEKEGALKEGKELRLKSIQYKRSFQSFDACAKSRQYYVTTRRRPLCALALLEATIALTYWLARLELFYFYQCYVLCTALALPKAAIAWQKPKPSRRLRSRRHTIHSRLRSRHTIHPKYTQSQSCCTRNHDLS